MNIDNYNKYKKYKYKYLKKKFKIGGMMEESQLPPPPQVLPQNLVSSRDEINYTPILISPQENQLSQGDKVKISLDDYYNNDNYIVIELNTYIDHIIYYIIYYKMTYTCSDLLLIFYKLMGLGHEKSKVICSTIYAYYSNSTATKHHLFDSVNAISVSNDVVVNLIRLIEKNSNKDQIIDKIKKFYELMQNYIGIIKFPNYVYYNITNNNIMLYYEYEYEYSNTNMQNRKILKKIEIYYYLYQQGLLGNKQIIYFFLFNINPHNLTPDQTEIYNNIYNNWQRQNNYSLSIKDFYTGINVYLSNWHT